MLDLTGRKALITGGSRGIGLSIAETLAAAGADVAICARGETALKNAKQLLLKQQRLVSARSCDLSDQQQVRQWVDQAVQDLGGCDILINNASGFGRTDDEQGWMASVQIDLMGTVRATHAALAHMQQGGSIVHISSTAGLKASPRTPPYGAVKAAIMEYTKTQAVALAPRKIRVNCIAPGSIYFEGGTWDDARQNNPKLYEKVLSSIPWGRYGTPQEVANLALFLVSDMASWVTGQTIAADGGQVL
jgi:3-oxoacyl-[acyl-carrier protein] reductase